MLGWTVQVLWRNCEKKPGVYDFSGIDKVYNDAVAAHKQLGAHMRLLDSYPDWVAALPGAKTYSWVQKGETVKMLLPWDPVVQPKLLAFIAAFCQHFDGKLDFIAMGGFGYKIESYMPLPSQIGLISSVADYSATYIKSCSTLLDTYNANLKQTPFVLAGGLPFSDPTAQDTIKAVINAGLKYPNFGIMQWGLNAISNNGFVINKFIQDNDAGRATGFQLTGASDGSSGGDLKGTLEQCLASGQSLGADFIEVYYVDVINPIYAALLAQFNASLK